MKEKKKKNRAHGRDEKVITGWAKGVLMYQGATQLVLILSFAHSHAKFFVS